MIYFLTVPGDHTVESNSFLSLISKGLAECDSQHVGGESGEIDYMDSPVP